ncbi:MAG TPA: hypothetical protein VGJ04_00015, partial [Pirellulales bacterium]
AVPGDVVVYSDSAIEFIADIHPLIEICLQGSGPMLFQTHDHLNIAWTKRDCLIGMDCDTPRFHRTQQLMGGLQIYRRCETSSEFVQSWLSYCFQEHLLTDSPNTCGLPNYPEFVEHRHDQSVLSLLAEKWRLPIYRDPSQWGNRWALPEFRPPGTSPIESSLVTGSVTALYDNSPYGQLINHHRCRKGPERRRILPAIRAIQSFRYLDWRRKAA